MQLQDEEDKFNMYKLQNLSCEDEWRQNTKEEVVIWSSSIFISSHKDHKEFMQIEENVSHANIQFHYLISQISTSNIYINHNRDPQKKKLKEQQRIQKGACESRGIG